jgi:hypothetical protein
MGFKEVVMKVFSNRTFLFRADNDNLTHVVKPGFGSAPDWVEKTELYQAAIADGSIKPFESSSDKAMEQVLKDEEKAAYERKIADLQAEIEALKTPITEEDQESDFDLQEEETPEPALVPKKKKR